MKNTIKFYSTSINSNDIANYLIKAIQEKNYFNYIDIQDIKTEEDVIKFWENLVDEISSDEFYLGVIADTVIHYENLPVESFETLEDFMEEKNQFDLDLIYVDYETRIAIDYLARENAVAERVLEYIEEYA